MNVNEKLYWHHLAYPYIFIQFYGGGLPRLIPLIPFSHVAKQHWQAKVSLPSFLFPPYGLKCS